MIKKSEQRMTETYMMTDVTRKRSVIREEIVAVVKLGTKFDWDDWKFSREIWDPPRKKASGLSRHFTFLWFFKNKLYLFIFLDAIYSAIYFLIILSIKLSLVQFFPLTKNSIPGFWILLVTSLLTIWYFWTSFSVEIRLCRGLNNLSLLLIFIWSSIVFLFIES